MIQTYTAGTGLTLVGNEFNTCCTGYFDSVAIGTDGYIYHSGDTDTYIQFTNDEIQIAAGGRTYIKIEEDSVDKLMLNHGALDIDLQVKGENDANLIRTDAENDRVGIGTSEPDHKLDVDGVGGFRSGIVASGSISGDAMVLTGHLAANTKSFLIDHPTIEGKQLQYASLEGPEHGVYIRGYTDVNTIPLPDYWRGLVDADSLTVHLTSKDFAQPNLFVSGVLDNTIYLNSDGQMISTYYTVNGTRKDVELLEVEI